MHVRINTLWQDLYSHTKCELSWNIYSDPTNSRNLPSHPVRPSLSDPHQPHTLSFPPIPIAQLPVTSYFVTSAPQYNKTLIAVDSCQHHFTVATGPGYIIPFFWIILVLLPQLKCLCHLVQHIYPLFITGAFSPTCRHNKYPIQREERGV